MGYKRGRGYYTRGWEPALDRTLANLKHKVYDPETDCPKCKGTGMVDDHKENLRRHCFMRRIVCDKCTPGATYPADSRK